MFKIDWQYIRTNVLHGSYIVVAALIGYLYLPDEMLFSVMMPVTGYLVALFYITNGKSLGGLAVGALFGFYGITVLRGMAPSEAVPIAVVYASVLLAEAWAVHVFVRPIDERDLPAFERLSVYGLVILTIMAVGTIVILMAHLLVPTCGLPVTWECFFIGTTGQFLSTLLFSYAVTRNHNHGHHYHWRDFQRQWLPLLSIFLIMLVMVFDRVTFITFDNHKYFLLLFFVFAPFRHRRTAITHYINMIVVMYGFELYLDGLSERAELYPLILNLILFLIAMISTAMIMYHFNDNIQSKSKEARESAKRIEEMFYSTTDILNISTDLLDRSYRLDRFFMKRAFQIALRLFDKYDSASCYYFENDQIVFIDAHNYDVDFLNTLTFFKPELGNKRIIIRNNIETIIQDELQDEYDAYNQKYKPIKHSLSLYTTMENNIFYGMTFDILEGNDDLYTAEDASKMQSFQHFLDNAYEIHRTQYQKDKFLTDIVDALINTLELYDIYTGTHSQDVAFVSRKLAEKVNLERARMTTVYWAAVLHDIGKIGVPEAIINKPGKLTDDEYARVKQHSRHGFDILDKTESLQDIARLVRHHHEHWNGNGYPDGLKETEIPYGSAIIGIADAVSSMLTKRPYSRVRTMDEVKDELRRCRGTQFHPQLADAMIELLDEEDIRAYFQPSTRS